MFCSIKIDIPYNEKVLNIKNISSIVKKNDLTINFNFANIPLSKSTKKFDTKKEQDDFFKYLISKFEAFNLPTENLVKLEEDKA